MRAAVVLGILALATPARADTLRRLVDVATGSDTGELRAKIEQARQQIEGYIAVGNAFYANNKPVEAAVDLFAEAAAGVDRGAGAGQGSIGAQLALRGERCDIAQLGVSFHGDLRGGDPHTLGGADQWGQLCLSGGLSLGALGEATNDTSDLGSLSELALFPLVLRESAQLDARPRLTAARAAIDEPYSRLGFGFDVEGARYAWRAHHGIGFIGFTADQFWRWRELPGGDTAKVELSGDVWVVRLFHERGVDALADRAVDIIAFGFHGIQADNGAAIITFFPVRFTALGIGPALVDAWVGIGGTGTLSSSTSGPGVNDMTTIDTTGLPEVDAALAHAAVYGGDREHYVQVAYDRTVDTNVLADVIREDRWSLAGTVTDPTWLLRGNVFVSRARYYLDESVRADEKVAGAAVTASYTFPHHLTAGVTLEGVVGLDDRDPALDGHALPRGLRAFATLSTTQSLWKSGDGVNLVNQAKVDKVDTVP